MWEFFFLYFVLDFPVLSSEFIYLCTGEPFLIYRNSPDKINIAREKKKNTYSSHIKNNIYKNVKILRL